MSRHHADRSLARRKCDAENCSLGWALGLNYCPKCKGTGRLNLWLDSNPPHDFDVAWRFRNGMPCVWSRAGKNRLHTVGRLWPSRSERRVVRVAARIIRRAG